MNRYQNHKMDSYRASLALLVNATETQAIPGFTVKRTAFSQKVEAIVTLIAEQAKATVGKAAERNRVLGAMTTAALALAGKLRSHAAERQLSDLLATVWVTPTDFAKSRDADKIVTAQAIHDAAHAVLGDLAFFEITAASLVAVQEKIDAAKDALPLTRAAIADRKAATEQLAVAFRAADDFREQQLDPLLLPLKETNPQFHAKYQARRRVKRPGFRSEDEDGAEKGGESGASTGAPMTVPDKPAA